MAFQWIRSNLSAAVYPFATVLSDRTIIVPGYDQNYDRIADASSTVKNRGIPQAMYMHNCVPTSQGYQSVGYNEYIMPKIPASLNFDTVFPLTYTTPFNAKILFSPSLGENNIFDGIVGEWRSISPFPDGTINALTLVTTAIVNGIGYIYYESLGCYTYNLTTKLLDLVTLIGLTASAVKGITSAQGYMIAWSETDIAWSSATTPTDFTPSAITGSGGGSPQFAKGKILFCVPISGGFMIYCEQNVVSATYSGNINFPFIFAEVANSGGVVSPEQVSYQSNLASHYAWTTSGFQELTKTSATGIFPEATDFLSALYYEDFDETTLVFIEEFLTVTLSVKLSAIADRFIVISYGKVAGIYTYALVYDIFLKRWGKFKTTHVKCFEWNAPNIYGEVTYDDLSSTTYDDLSSATYDDLLTSVDTPIYQKKQLCFLQSDGRVQAVNFDMKLDNANGVLFVGKFQFTRNNFIVHQESAVESINTEFDNFNFYLMKTLDGKTFLPLETPVNVYTGPKIQKYNRRMTGQNISAVFIGAFNLTSYLIQFTQGGDR